MKDFKRGLDENALKLVDVFLKKEVGIRIIKDPNMFICIRNNYINVYLNGCCLLKYSPFATKNEYLIHHKYFGVASSEDIDEYIPMKLNNEDLEYEGRSFIEEIIDNPNCHLKSFTEKTKRNGDFPEKALLAQFISNAKPFVIDFEVAYTRARTDEEMKEGKRKAVADRIDLAILAEKDGRIVLRMIEVKVDNDARLKSSIKCGQEILRQMEYYRTFLNKQRPHILKSYLKVAENYLQLNILNKFPGKIPEVVLRNFIENARTQGDFSVLDMEPYLLILQSKNIKNILQNRNDSIEKGMKGRNDVNHFQILQEDFNGRGYRPIITWANNEISSNILNTESIISKV